VNFWVDLGRPNQTSKKVFIDKGKENLRKGIFSKKNSQIK